MDIHDLPTLHAGLTRWIQSPACHTESGAVVAWRDFLTAERSFEYPEICGYFLTLAAGNFSAPVGDRTADWLMNRIQAQNFTARPNGNGEVFTFDLAMIAAGLVNYGVRFERPACVSTGLTVAELVAEAVSELRSVHPLSKETQPAGVEKWSTTGDVHLLKCAQSLLLAAANGLDNAVVKDAIKRVEDHVYTAGWRTCPGEQRLALHPLMYGVEGRWIFGMASDSHSAVEVAERILSEVWRYQLPCGGFPEWVDPSGPGSRSGPEQHDVLAQVVRMTALLKLRAEGQGRAVRRLTRSAVWDRDGASIPYRPEPAEVHQNSWTTMFSIQALQALQNREITWASLV